jgi:hypothetical protein
MHHEEGLAICPSCENKLQHVNSLLVQWYREIKKDFPDCHISCGWRGEQEQNEAFARGASHRKWPLSKHNAINTAGKPCSRAIDLFQLKDGKALFQYSYYGKIAARLLDWCAPIVWGGDWNNNKIKDKEDFDSPHFQLDNKQS